MQKVEARAFELKFSQHNEAQAGPREESFLYTQKYCKSPEEGCQIRGHPKGHITAP